MNGHSRMSAAETKTHGLSGRYKGGLLALLFAVITAGLLPLGQLPFGQPGALAQKAKNPVYTISNFQVWAEAKNAVAAKRAALEDGKVVAFGQLLRRISLLSQPLKGGPQATAADVSQMITSLGVKDERNSTTEYIAKLDFQFSEDAVKRYLRGRGIAYYDRQGPQVTLVPVVDLGLLTPLPGETKPQLSQEDWETSWKTLDLAHGLVPLKLAERLAVVDDSVLAALVRGESAAREGLLKAYKSERVVLALVSAGSSAKKVRLTLVGRDDIGDVTYKRDHVISDGDMLQAVDHAAEVALGLIEARLKLLKMRPVLVAKKPVEVLPWQTDLQEAAPLSGWQGDARGERILMHVQFQGLSHWQSIRRRLMGVDGLEELNINKLSARGADVSLDYPGGAPALVGALRPLGFTMTPTGQGWLLVEG